ncbi:MAG TPA: hypothetical protein VF103_17025, partial [Polyangiaceae bacterium]
GGGMALAHRCWLMRSALRLVNMRVVARVAHSALLWVVGCDGSFAEEPVCPVGSSSVSVNKRLGSLDGETASERFDRATKAWSCTVTWLELPAAIGVSEPPAGTTELELVLGRTSETARYREDARTGDQKWEGTKCPTASVFVPCSLGLVSDDGALDEAFDCELRLQGENTLVHLLLSNYEFSGSHALTFAGDIPVDSVELNLAYTPGPDPTRIDGSIVEYGTRDPGVDPFVTTAMITCTE